MKTIICNDFSFDMIDEDCDVHIQKLSLDEFFKILQHSEYDIRIGDKDIADMFGLKISKGNIVLGKDTRLIIIKSLNIATGKGYNFYSIQRED